MGWNGQGRVCGNSRPKRGVGSKQKYSKLGERQKNTPVKRKNNPSSGRESPLLVDHNYVADNCGGRAGFTGREENSVLCRSHTSVLMAAAWPLLLSACTCEGQPCPGRAFWDTDGGWPAVEGCSSGSSSSCGLPVHPAAWTGPPPSHIVDFGAWGFPSVNSISMLECCLLCFLFVCDGSYF